MQSLPVQRSNTPLKILAIFSLIFAAALAAQQRWSLSQEDSSTIESYMSQNKDCGAEWEKGIRYLQSEDISAEIPNHALTLFAHILRETNPPRCETMPMAIALANSLYFGMGDEQIRETIKSEVVEQYRLYREINSWQESLPVSMELSRLPLIPQIYWASLDREVKKVNNLEEYRKIVPRIQDLRDLRASLLKSGAFRGDSPEEIAYGLHRYFRANLTPVERLPANRRGWYFPEIYPLYRDTGKFAAIHCVAAATNLWILFRAMGMPVLTYYQNSRNAQAQTGVHEWPAFYHRQTGRWMTVQRGSPWPRLSNPDIPVHFELFRPIWQHKRFLFEKKQWDALPEKSRAPAAHIGGHFRSNSLYELSTNAAMRRFVFHGMEETLMEQLWEAPASVLRPQGYLVNVTTAPQNAADSDGDGLYDVREIQLNLNPRSPDTDGDLAADLWELEHRMDAKSPERQIAPVIDGFTLEGEGLALQMEGEVRAAKIGDRLYISRRSPPAHLEAALDEIWMLAVEQGSAKKYFRFLRETGGLIRSPDGWQGTFASRAYRDMEVLIGGLNTKAPMRVWLYYLLPGENQRPAEEKKSGILLP